MFERLANGWDLAKQSLEVLKMDKEMLVFPLLSGLSCLIVLASFGVPLWAGGQLEFLMDGGDEVGAQNPLLYVLLFLFYFANYFVIIFFNSALVACAIVRFNGGDPTVATGLRMASKRLPQIFGWALVAATVGMVLKVIESRSEKVGQFVTALLGTAWSITTYFVVPILVVEKANPLDAFKRSVSIIKKNWGEALGASFGIGWIVFLMTLVAAIPAILGFISGNPAFMAAGFAVSVLLWIVISLISSALDTIVIAALYMYASEGKIPEQFHASSLKGAFTRK